MANGSWCTRCASISRVCWPLTGRRRPIASFRPVRYDCGSMFVCSAVRADSPRITMLTFGRSRTTCGNRRWSNCSERAEPCAALNGRRKVGVCRAEVVRSRCVSFREQIRHWLERQERRHLLLRDRTAILGSGDDQEEAEVNGDVHRMASEQSTASRGQLRLPMPVGSARTDALSVLWFLGSTRPT